VVNLIVFKFLLSGVDLNDLLMCSSIQKKKGVFIPGLLLTMFMEPWEVNLTKLLGWLSLVAILCRFFSCLFFMLVISVYLGQ